MENHPEIPKLQCNCSKKTSQQEPSVSKNTTQRSKKEKKPTKKQKNHPAAKHR